MMPFLMRGRNESAVYFDQQIDLTRTLPWLAEYNAAHEQHTARIFHLLLAAIPRALSKYPNLNRYVAGLRLRQRSEVILSFAMKPERKEGSMSVLKMVFPPDEPFADMLDRILARVEAGRAGRRSRSDKEASLFSRLPAPLLDVGVRVFRAVDFLGLVPASMIDADPMYCSVFIANLGSLGMDAAYHHLYEHGTCPIFATIGRIEQIPVVVDDRVEPRTIVRIRYTYDERVEDGFYAGRALGELQKMLEDPASWIT